MTRYEIIKLLNNKVDFKFFNLLIDKAIMFEDAGCLVEARICISDIRTDYHISTIEFYKYTSQNKEQKISSKLITYGGTNRRLLESYNRNGLSYWISVQNRSDKYNIKEYIKFLNNRYTKVPYKFRDHNLIVGDIEQIGKKLPTWFVALPK